MKPASGAFIPKVSYCLCSMCIARTSFTGTLDTLSLVIYSWELVRITPTSNIISSFLSRGFLKKERVVIQTRLKDGWTPNRITGELGCAPNTVRNEIKRGTVTLYRGNIVRYKAKVGQAAYEKNREACCRHYDLLEKSTFISYVEEHFFEDEWSLDVCAHRALKDGTFIRNIDLPEKLHRSSKTARVRENKRILGRSIEERPASIEDRTEFGHWEVDLVIGSKSGNDDALLTMIERRTREYWMMSSKRSPRTTAPSSHCCLDWRT